jgi:hypothetical protein
MKYLISQMIEYKQNLLRRDYLIDMFTEAEYDSIPEESQDNQFIYVPEKYLDKLFPKYYLGKVVLDKQNNLCIINKVENDSNFVFEKIPKTEIHKNRPLINLYDVFVITKEHLPNVKTSEETTVGRFILNYLLLVLPFGDKIPYVNDIYKASEIETQIIDELKHETISIDSVRITYRKNLYYIGHFNELCVPGLSEKSIVPAPNAEKIKEEFIKKNPDIHDNPLKMAELQELLIQNDKEYLSDDDSYGFLGAKEGKSFDICRKEMFSSMGMVKDISGEKDYIFMNKSLDEGLAPKDLVVGNNETRIGVYKRAVDTAVGGTIVENIRRIMQEVKVTGTDCKTTEGQKIEVTSINKKDLIFRYILENNQTTLLTRDNIDKYMGKTISLRSPMYCKQKTGVCKKCADHKYTQRSFKEDDNLSVTMEETDIGSAILTDSMKAMHGKKTEILKIEDLNIYLI